MSKYSRRKNVTKCELLASILIFSPLGGKNEEKKLAVKLVKQGDVLVQASQLHEAQ